MNCFLVLRTPRPNFQASAGLLLLESQDSVHRLPLDKRHHFNVYQVFIRHHLTTYRCLVDVETTSRVYWVCTPIQTDLSKPVFVG